MERIPGMMFTQAASPASTSAQAILRASSSLSTVVKTTIPFIPGFHPVKNPCHEFHELREDKLSVSEKNSCQVRLINSFLGFKLTGYDRKRKRIALLGTAPV